MDIAVNLSVYEKGRRAPEWTVDSDINGKMSLADLIMFTRNSLIIVADQALREEQGKGFDKNPVVTVDGRTGKPVTAVNPFGEIVFTARANLNEVLLEAYRGIASRSPVDTGQYKKSNYVFLNGKQVANSEETLNAWLATQPNFKQNDLIRFVNIQPYARKLERLGVTAQNQGKRRASRTVKSKDKRGRFGFGGRILAPNGAYFLTAKQIKRKYKNNSSIDFEFMPGSKLGLAARFKTISMRRTKSDSMKTYRRKKPGSTYLYPTIRILVNEGGIK